MSLSREEIDEIVRVAAQEAAKKAVAEQTAEAVRQTLIQLGIASDDPLEMQKDMQHLREWRRSMEGIRTKGIMFIMFTAFSGAVAAFWIGFKELIHK